MTIKRLLLLTLLLIIGCQQSSIGADNPAVPVSVSVKVAKLDRQLKINRDALLAGSSDQIRIDAAAVMLFSDNLLARKILLDVLGQSENSAARIAVCRALSQTRATQQPIADKDDFIQPLLDIISTENVAEAKLAAEAILIFEYGQISKPLERIATEPSLPSRARLNAIYALRLQPDMKAIFKLMELLDDSDGQVAAESEAALHSLGIPVGKDAETRRQIIRGLERKGRDEFLRDWLVRQEAHMRSLETRLDNWQQRYLAALGKIYDGISDDAARGKFLAGYLGDSEAIVRLWALEKVYQGRVGTMSKLPAEFGPVLVKLISDDDREVRLKTAKLLSLMGQLDSTEKLLEQLKIEQDDEVKTELFVALGGACYYAFLPNSGIKVSPQIRREALQWAEKYLFEQDTKKAQKGAEVIKKLLEQDGLTAIEVDKYLGLLVQRYNQRQGNGTFHGELLTAMAGLCAQSIYKADSARLFRPLFEDALNDETDLVRQAAVDGLIYIDKTMALKRVRAVLVNDSSIVVRKKLIELAGEVGGREDLPWLAEKMTIAAEAEPAWQAMLRIFKRSESLVINNWIARLDSQGTKAVLSDEQYISFLEIAEAKASGENKTDILENVRGRLSQLYIKNGEFERAAGYLGTMAKLARTAEQKEQILASLLDVYLRWPNVELAGQLVTNRLLEKDLDPNSATIRSIDDYLSGPVEGGADPNAVLTVLARINVSERPMWQQQLKRWRWKGHFVPAPRLQSGPNEPNQDGN